MKISIIDNNLHIRTATDQLAKKLLSPFCGMNTHINFVSHETKEPRLLTAGGELTGVHLLQGLPKSRPGIHHIGGSGTYLNEALIKTLGETIERYSQLVAEVNSQHKIVFATYHEMHNRNEDIIDSKKLNFFSDEQFSLEKFPFQKFQENKPMGWVKAFSLTQKKNIWVPAQLLFVGYTIKRQEGEPWIFSSVTTGTAAHTTPQLALRSALLELTQLDSAMGHWYTNTQAPLIQFDERTRIVEKYILETLPVHAVMPKFFWIKNADLSDFTIACVFETSGIPKVAVGLGADTSLNDAICKAYLEATGVVALSKIILIDKELSLAVKSFDEKHAYNLDTNVGYYACGKNYAKFKDRFDDSFCIKASDLPADLSRLEYSDIQCLTEKFTCLGKDLFYLDMTASEAKTLGFSVARVWSPDTLSLCLPSAPPITHMRFKAYGGVTHVAPHPYP